jgi:drug/metabolite transporter (DMT)-like permease
MIIQKLTWDANLSAFSMWVIVGFLINTSSLKINPIFKGWLYAFLALTPCAIIIFQQDPISLLPITILTLVLSGLLGFFLEKTKKLPS